MSKDMIPQPNADWIAHQFVALTKEKQNALIYFMIFLLQEEVNIRVEIINGLKKEVNND